MTFYTIDLIFPLYSFHTKRLESTLITIVNTKSSTEFNNHTKATFTPYEQTSYTDVGNSQKNENEEEDNGK